LSFIFFFALYIFFSNGSFCSWTSHGVTLNLLPLIGMKFSATYSSTTGLLYYTPCGNFVGGTTCSCTCSNCSYMAVRKTAPTSNCNSIVTVWDSTVQPSYNDITKTFTFYYFQATTFQLNFVCDYNSLYTNITASYNNRYIMTIYTSLACGATTTTTTPPGEPYTKFSGKMYPRGDNQNSTAIFIEINLKKAIFYTKAYGTWIAYIMNGQDVTNDFAEQVVDHESSESVGHVIIKSLNNKLLGVYVAIDNSIYYIDAIIS